MASYPPPPEIILQAVLVLRPDLLANNHPIARTTAGGAMWCGVDGWLTCVVEIVLDIGGDYVLLAVLLAAACRCLPLPLLPLLLVHNQQLLSPYLGPRLSVDWLTGLTATRSNRAGSLASLTHSAGLRTTDDGKTYAPRLHTRPHASTPTETETERTIHQKCKIESKDRSGLSF